ncbi:hypothetical protein RV03_GL000738 [Enterococcus gallinarum]|nr:hypothetical protein RV03_GL000738 [Enterococcus gallinarum]
MKYNEKFLFSQDAFSLLKKLRKGIMIFTSKKPHCSMKMQIIRSLDKGIGSKTWFIFINSFWLAS